MWFYFGLPNAFPTSFPPKNGNVMYYAKRFFVCTKVTKKVFLERTLLESSSSSSFEFKRRFPLTGLTNNTAFNVRFRNDKNVYFLALLLSASKWLWQTKNEFPVITFLFIENISQIKHSLKQINIQKELGEQPIMRLFTFDSLTKSILVGW